MKKQEVRNTLYKVHHQCKLAYMVGKSEADCQTMIMESPNMGFELSVVSKYMVVGEISGFTNYEAFCFDKNNPLVDMEDFDSSQRQYVINNRLGDIDDEYKEVADEYDSKEDYLAAEYPAVSFSVELPQSEFESLLPVFSTMSKNRFENYLWKYLLENQKIILGEHT